MKRQTIAILKQNHILKKRMMKKLSLSFIKNFIGVKYLNKSYPLWIDLRVTNKCNLKCIYCGLPNQKLKDMSFDEMKAVLDKITTRSWIMITGGEPLLRKDIGKIINHIVFHTPHHVMLNTNLLLLKEKYEQIKYCDGFYFSLDGPKATHEKAKGKGIWDKVIQAIEFLYKEKRGKISMTVITANTTLEDIKAVLEMANEYEIIPAFQIVTHYSLSGSSKSFSPKRENSVKILDYLIEQRKKGVILNNHLKGLMTQKKLLDNNFCLPCFSGRLYCIIDSDGMLGLCFARPRDENFLSLNDPDVSFDKALQALRKVKPHNVRCEDGCNCITQIEFGLTNLWNLNEIKQVNKSFSKFVNLENNYAKKMNSAASSLPCPGPGIM
jgi:MoaA/NifB/PqqE/SkfB family radical SAM enzyme